jgi:DNA helicase TIP49 (TBP-interacting protein)
MNTSIKMFTNDPAKFYLLAEEVKFDLIQAGIATVNVMATVGRKGAVKNVKEKFTNRNTFTARQVQFTPMPQSKYIKISAIHATLGATDNGGALAASRK